MKIYVAAPFSEAPRVRLFMARLRAAGHEITCDWTRHAETWPDDDAPAAVRKGHAREDLDGVALADVFVLLTVADRSKGCGMWVELGAALAWDLPVVLVGPQRSRSIFCALADVFVDTDDEAIAVLTRGELGVRSTELGEGW